jgi:hypothetical protein
VTEPTYYARLGRKDTVERPKGLIRRVHTQPYPSDQVLRRDGEWHSTDVLERAALGDLLDELVEIPAEQAAEIASRWRAVTDRLEHDLTAQGRGELGLRLARSVDTQRDAQGQPVSTGEPLDQFDRVSVGRYLKNAPVVVAAHGFDVDPFDPARPEVVPLHIHTDGLWVWSESLAYFATVYGIGPEPELLAHLRQRQYRLPEVDREVLRQAARLAVG